MAVAASSSAQKSQAPRSSPPPASSKASSAKASSAKAAPAKASPAKPATAAAKPATTTAKPAATAAAKPATTTAKPAATAAATTAKPAAAATKAATPAANAATATPQATSPASKTAAPAASAPNALQNRLAPSGAQNATAAARTSAAPATAQRPGIAPTSAPTPDKPGQPAEAYDGHLMGANGQTYPPGTRPQDIPPTTPNNGKKPTETIIFVNGIGTSPGGNKDHLQEIANSSGQNVVGVYNATQGFLPDIIQSGKDKIDVGTNHAVNTLTNSVYDGLKQNQPLHIMSHSQGALITSRALSHVKERLMNEDHLTQAQAEARMNQLKVETFGGAASSYPDGPKYVHYVNRADLVATELGLGPFGFASGDGGRDAKINRFGWYNPLGIFTNDAHDTKTYFEHWKPFDQAYNS